MSRRKRKKKLRKGGGYKNQFFEKINPFVPQGIPGSMKRTRNTIGQRR